MIKLLDLLKEDKGKFDYGCVMLYFDFPNINEIQNKIDSEDIFTKEGDRSFGLETDPHITLLYGLHEEVTTQQVINILEGSSFGEIILHNVSLFETPEYDVLKFDVKYPSRGIPFLHKMNKLLITLPHTTSFPDYHPHMTIGYLNSGSGKKYVELFKDLEFTLEPSYLVYSKPNGTEIKIELK